MTRGFRQISIWNEHKKGAYSNMFKWCESDVLEHFEIHKKYYLRGPSSHTKHHLERTFTSFIHEMPVRRLVLNQSVLEKIQSMTRSTAVIIQCSIIYS